jgi:hypothetical protein
VNGYADPAQVAAYLLGPARRLQIPVASDLAGVALDAPAQLSNLVVQLVRESHDTHLLIERYPIANVTPSGWTDPVGTGGPMAASVDFGGNVHELAATPPPPRRLSTARPMAGRKYTRGVERALLWAEFATSLRTAVQARPW